MLALYFGQGDSLTQPLSTIICFHNDKNGHSKTCKNELFSLHISLIETDSTLSIGNEMSMAFLIVCGCLLPALGHLL